MELVGQDLMSLTQRWLWAILSFIQHIFIGHLLCAQPCSLLQGYGGDKTESPMPL